MQLIDEILRIVVTPVRLSGTCGDSFLLQYAEQENSNFRLIKKESFNISLIGL